MKTIRFFIGIFLIFALLFCGCGKKKETRRNPVNPPRTVLNPKIEVEEDSEETSPEIISYEVKLKGKTLSLYEVNGAARKLITSAEINPEFYPEEDVRKLQNGIEAYCKEDGYEILENFTN